MKIPGLRTLVLQSDSLQEAAHPAANYSRPRAGITLLHVLISKSLCYSNWGEVAEEARIVVYREFYNR